MSKIKDCTVKEIVVESRGVWVLSPDINNYIVGALFVTKDHAAPLAQELSTWITNKHQFNYMIPNDGMTYTVVFSSGYSIAFDNQPFIEAYMICPGWDTLVVHFTEETILELLEKLNWQNS